MDQRFLLLDTTYAISSYALATERKGIVALQHHTEAREQAVVINTVIETLLEENGWAYGDLSGIIICSGPGSYTGMRISYSVAKGLCYALDIPLVAVDRLSVLVSDQSVVSLVALFARTGEYFAGVHNGTEWLMSPRHCEAGELTAYLQEWSPQQLITDVVPDGWQDGRMVTVLPADLQQPLDMGRLGVLGMARHAAGIFEDIAYCEPLYLKSVYTTVPGKKSIL